MQFLDRRNIVIYVVRNLFYPILFSHSVLLISNRASAGILHGNWQFPDWSYVNYLTVYVFLGLFNDGNCIEPLLPEPGGILFEFSNWILMQFWSLYLGPAVSCSELASRIHYGTWRNSFVSYTHNEPTKFLYRYRKWSCPCPRHESVKGSRGITLLILNMGAEIRRVVSFTPRQLHLPGKNCGTNWIRC